MPTPRGYADAMDTTQPVSVQPASTLLQWRLLALLYDLFPAIGLWALVGLMAVAVHGGATIRSDTPAGWMELLALWAVTGAYAIASWRGGGQTLGMRPWRLHVTAADGARASLSALLRRYVIGTLSLLLAGAGFWWALLDRDRLAWHDRASATRITRSAKNKSP